MKQIIGWMLLFALTTLGLVAENQTLIVRVFEKDQFIENLKIEDFQASLDNHSIPVKSFKLIKKNTVTPPDATPPAKWGLNRQYIFVFFMRNYYPQLDQSIQYFFENTLMTGDSLSIFTTQKTYNLKSVALEKMPKKQLTQQLKDLIRRDITQGSSEYKSLLASLVNIVTSIDSITAIDDGVGGSLSSKLMSYRDALTAMDNFRYKELAKIFTFLKSQEASDHPQYVFFLYEKELKPDISPNTLSQLNSIMTEEMDVLAQLSDLFETYKQESSFNIKEKCEEFSKNAYVLNFIAFGNEFDRRSNVRMSEHGEDIFNMFQCISKASGGLTSTTQTPSGIFIKGLNFTDNYYILEVDTGNVTAKTKPGKIQLKIKNPQAEVFYKSIF